ncbi:hypothetical protein [Legionella brunensis]|uniref:Uncharacterized protein n=1 Tax=Legionella brunensis TaxID=29422 RepID=A0A0W0SU98_9GAMM|nr:hypothetical protein [Legionella brunensis]KTC86950.1 hypothetical protein Lbru_0179 [Legionella brunensis]
MGISSSRSAYIEKQETHVRRQLKEDPRASYLKKQGYSNAQLLGKFRQEYNNPNWRSGDRKDAYISRSKMAEAERHTPSNFKY